MEPEDLTPWLTRIAVRQEAYRNKIGPAKLALLTAAARLLSGTRRVSAARRPEEAKAGCDLQLPWFPCWPGLAARPIHSSSEYTWARILQQASGNIREELLRVCESFERARYDSDLNKKPWRTYYFYLEGKAVPSHLAACPTTRDVLRQIPHNGLHVCFSAIAPGGSLSPHTGPTNTSLTAHLGLANCKGSKLWVAGQAIEYKDDEVLVFDDSFVHWVEHNGTETRYTLMITVWHPDLNKLERMFLRSLVSTTA